MTEEAKPNLKCVSCGKETTPYTNYCDWDCSIEFAKKNGGVVHCPNGLPIKCITRDNLMIECEHGDHPDYKFPVDVEYLGDAFETPEFEIAMYGRLLKDDEERRRCMGETHALIYADGCVAVTLYECCYYMWHLDKGSIAGGPSWGKLSGYKEGKFHHGDLKLSEESRLKIITSKQPNAAEQEPP